LSSETVFFGAEQKSRCVLEGEMCSYVTRARGERWAESFV